MGTKLRFLVLVAIAFLFWRPAGAGAQEVRIFAAGAVEKAAIALAGELQRRHGHTVSIVADTVGALRDRVRAGETPDLVILSSAEIRDLGAAGRLAATASVPIGRTGVGLCVKAGAPVPNISTPAALRATLLAAVSFVHADPARGATAGTHIRKVIAALGLTEVMAGRIHVVPFGGAIAGDVAAGRYALGASQATEIVANPNVTFVGFLPEPHQLWTQYEIAAVASPTPASSAFVELARSPFGQTAFGAIGFR